MKRKYYSTLRPVSIGTYPKGGAIEIVNFDNRKHIDEINHAAWGYIIYDRELTPDEAAAYDLVCAPTHKLWSDLDPAIYTRLCECRNLKSDISPLARSYFRHKQSTSPGAYTPADALADVLDWLDSNSQYFDLTTDECNDIISEIS